MLKAVWWCVICVCAILKIFTSAHPGCGGFSAEDRMKNEWLSIFSPLLTVPQSQQSAITLRNGKRGVCVWGGGSSKAGVYLKALVNQENTVDSWMRNVYVMWRFGALQGKGLFKVINVCLQGWPDHYRGTMFLKVKDDCVLSEARWGHKSVKTEMIRKY